MCSVINFENYLTEKNGRNKRINRCEALAKGLIEEYICNNCGGDIEVIDKDFPSHCPNCGATISEWDCCENEEAFRTTERTNKMSEQNKTSISNYGKRNKDIINYFRERGMEETGRNGQRDIHFGNVSITDQVGNFAIYALGEEREKDIFLKIFEKYNPMPGSIRRNPEKSNRRKCCARWEHSARDYEIMFNVVVGILGV